jgi:hypothetical protein
MTNTFSVAAQVLEQWGARVTPIETSQKDESDWLAEFGTYRLLVEEKTKFEEAGSQVARAASLAQGKVHGSTLSLSHNNRISGIVRKASKQLDSIADTNIPRADTGAVIRYLEDKYNLERAQNMDMHLASAVVAVRG